MDGSRDKINLKVGRTSRNEDGKKTGIQVLSEELRDRIPLGGNPLVTPGF